MHLCRVSLQLSVLTMHATGQIITVSAEDSTDGNVRAHSTAQDSMELSEHLREHLREQLKQLLDDKRAFNLQPTSYVGACADLRLQIQRPS